MLNLAKLTAEHFEPHLNTAFKVSSPDIPPLEVLLTEVSKLEELPEDAPSDLRRGFALLFRGPSSPVLTQSTCEIAHGEMGEMALFLVPVGQDEEGVSYEAVFN